MAVALGLAFAFFSILYLFRHGFDWWFVLGEVGGFSVLWVAVGLIDIGEAWGPRGTTLGARSTAALVLAFVGPMGALTFTTGWFPARGRPDYELTSIPARLGMVLTLFAVAGFCAWFGSRMRRRRG